MLLDFLSYFFFNVVIYVTNFSLKHIFVEAHNYVFIFTNLKTL